MSFAVARNDIVSMSVEGDFRFRDEETSFYDRWAGYNVDLLLAPRVKALGSYILRNRHRGDFGYGVEHRLTGGVDFRLPVRRWKVDAITLYERHMGRPDIPDFNRYRQQFDAEQTQARVSPWVHQDFAFRRGGFTRTRSRAGIRCRFDHYVVKVAYQFESLNRSSAWRPRHAIYTELRIDRPFWGGE